jgi:Uma2 family endonuclease
MWTREDCLKFEGMGVLPEKWELVQGEIIRRMGTQRPRSIIISRMLFWLMDVLSKDRILPFCSIDVAPEDNPINEPTPDLIVLNRADTDSDQSPSARELDLIVEVSDITIDFDLGPKAELYARAGIPEYWVLDINARVIHQHREPSAGRYNLHRKVTGANVLSPLAKPEATLTPAEIFE